MFIRTFKPFILIKKKKGRKTNLIYVPIEYNLDQARANLISHVYLENITPHTRDKLTTSIEKGGKKKSTRNKREKARIC